MPAAEAVPGSHVITYHDHLLTTTSPDGVLSETTVNVTRPHTWTNTSTESLLVVEATYTVTGAALVAPYAEFQIFWNATAIGGCLWLVTGSPDATHRANHALQLTCQLPSIAPGNHTVAIQLIDGQGTPITSATYSLILQQQESVLMDIDVNLTPEIFAHLAWIVWAAYFALTNLFRHPGIRFLAAFVGYAILALPIQELQFVWMFVGQTLAVTYQSFRYFTRLE